MTKKPEPEQAKKPADLEVITLLFEHAEVYVLALIRESQLRSDPNERAPSSIAARQRLINTIMELAEEGRLG